MTYELNRLSHNAITYSMTSTVSSLFRYQLLGNDKINVYLRKGLFFVLKQHTQWFINRQWLQGNTIETTT